MVSNDELNMSLGLLEVDLKARSSCDLCFVNFVLVTWLTSCIVTGGLSCAGGGEPKLGYGDNIIGLGQGELLPAGPPGPMPGVGVILRSNSPSPQAFSRQSCLFKKRFLFVGVVARVKSSALVTTLKGLLLVATSM